MKIFQRLLLTSAMLLLAQSAQAECAGVGCWRVTIERIWITETGVGIQTSGTETDLECSVPSVVPGQLNTGYLVLAKTHLVYDETYAALLAAHMSGRQITIELPGPGNPCEIQNVSLF